MMRLWLVLVLAMVLAACGGGEQSEPVTESEETVKVDIDKKKDSTLIKTEDGQEIEVAEDMNKSLDLPADYPNDLLPLYSDEFIALAMKQPDGSYSIMAMTVDSVEAVKTFYKNVIAEAEVITTQQEEDFYMSMGTIDGNTYTIIIQGEEEDEYDFETSYSLMIMPGQTMDMGEEADKATSDDPVLQSEKVQAPMVIPEGVQWPADYPSDQLPTYPTGNTQAAGGSEGMVGIMTEDPPEEVVTYYKELLEDAVDFSEISIAPMYMLTGTLDDKFLQVTVGPNDGTTGEADRFKTLIQIMYQ